MGVSGGVVLIKVFHSVMECLHKTLLRVSGAAMFYGFSLIAVLMGGE